MKHKKKFALITKRIILNIILAGLLLSVAICSVGFWSFTKEFKNQYDSSINAIAAAACQCLNPDKLTYYASSKEKDSDWFECQRVLQDFVDRFELNLIYVSIVDPPDYTHITYVFNPVRTGGRLNEYPLGYEEDYINKHYKGQ